MAIFSELWKVDLGPFGNKLFICSNWLITKKCKHQEFCMGYSIVMKLGMWVTVALSITHVFCCCRCTYHVPHLHICSYWLITKNAKIQSSVWATVTKLGMMVVVGTDITHVVCRQQICISNISFAYLFCLANNKKKANIQSAIWATVTKPGMLVVVGTSNTHWVCNHWMRIINTGISNIQMTVYGLQRRILVGG